MKSPMKLLCSLLHTPIFPRRYRAIACVIPVASGPPCSVGPVASGRSELDFNPMQPPVARQRHSQAAIHNRH